MALPSLSLLLLLLLLLAVSHSSSAAAFQLRRLLHQPFFPSESLSPPPPSPPPPENEDKPFFSSTTYTSPPPPTPPPPSPSPSPPPPSPQTSFPANISSLLLPQRSHHHLHFHLVALALTAALLSGAILAVVFLIFRRSSNHKSKSGSAPGSGAATPALSRTSEFLYLGTLVNSTGSSKTASPYFRLGSPELNPLPPLPKHTHNEDFFSPIGSGSSATPSFPSPPP